MWLPCACTYVFSCHLLLFFDKSTLVLFKEIYIYEWFILNIFSKVLKWYYESFNAFYHPVTSFNQYSAIVLWIKKWNIPLFQGYSCFKSFKCDHITTIRICIICNRCSWIFKLQNLDCVFYWSVNLLKIYQCVYCDHYMVLKHENAVLNIYLTLTTNDLINKKIPVFSF
jgi:hypothetical protein